VEVEDRQHIASLFPVHIEFSHLDNANHTVTWVNLTKDRQRPHRESVKATERNSLGFRIILQLSVDPVSSVRDGLPIGRFKSRA